MYGALLGKGVAVGTLVGYRMGGLVGTGGGVAVGVTVGVGMIAVGAGAAGNGVARSSCSMMGGSSVQATTSSKTAAGAKRLRIVLRLPQ